MRFHDIRNFFFLSFFLSLGFRIKVVQYLAQQIAQSIIIIRCHVTVSDRYQPVQSEHYGSIRIYKGIQDQHIVSKMCAHIVS
jgi:hypothetical protein